MLTRLLRTYLAPYKKLLAAVVVLQLIGTIASLYLPSLNADIIDNGVVHGDTGYILHIGSWMLAVSLIQIACSIAAVYCGAKAAMSFGRDVRMGIFAKVGEFSAREVGQFGAPSLITRNTNDVQQVQMLVVTTCTMMVMAPIMCVGGIIMALRQDVGLAWLMLVAVPALALAVGLIVSRMVPQFRAMQTRIDAVNRVLREQLSGIRVVRAFVRERYEANRFAAANEELTQTALRAGRLMVLIFPVVMFVFNASTVSVLWFGGHRVDSGQMQIGSLTAFLAYLVQILMSIMMATFMAMMIPRASVCADRIAEVLSTESSVVPPTSPKTPTTHVGEVELRHAGFAYPGADEPVLSDISFVARPGQTTAVVGSSGSGKSTVLSLIPRLYDATAGAVLVDGIDVREIEPAALWGRMGIVPGKPYLFTGTVASNLRYGKPDATDDELWEALEIAQASDFVAARRHQCLRRSATAALHRPGAGRPATGLPLRRLLLGARSRDRCQAARRPRSTHPACDGDRRSATGVHDCGRRPDPGPRQRSACR
jgi:ATP-binding cassette, subfamily B, multidrug efflux pump